MRMLMTALAAGTALSLMAGAASASADLTGDTIHAYYIYPSDGSVLNDLGTFTAPGGGSVYAESYSVSGSQVTVSSASGVYWVSAAYNGLQFVDETKDPHITSITLDPSTNATGVDISDASWTSNSFEFNFQGQTWASGAQAVFDLHFGTGVPEPASWALMILGVAGIGWVLRRKAAAPTLA